MSSMTNVSHKFARSENSHIFSYKTDNFLVSIYNVCILVHIKHWSNTQKKMRLLAQREVTVTQITYLFCHRSLFNSIYFTIFKHQRIDTNHTKCLTSNSLHRAVSYLEHLQWRPNSTDLLNVNVRDVNLFMKMIFSFKFELERLFIYLSVIRSGKRSFKQK